MLKRTILIAMAAFVLACASPFIAHLGGGFADPATHHGIFYVWFMAIPATVDQLVWPESDVGMIMLAVMVYTVQYLALFALLAAPLPAARFLQDFIAGPQHRRDGLVRPR